MILKKWVLHNWTILAWGIGLTSLAVGVLIINGQITKRTQPNLKVEKYCLELAKKIEGIDLNPSEATWVPIGNRARYLSYSGTMMVWEEEKSGISVNCSIISGGTQVKYFEVNGEDKTYLAIREEREE